MNLRYENKIKNIALSYDVYFVDYFDTVVHRSVYPDGTKRIWAEKIAELINFKYSPEQILHYRTDAEYMLSYYAINGQFTCEELYSLIAMQINLDGNEPRVSEKKFLCQALKMEEDVELEVQYLNDSLVEKLYELKKAGKKIFLVSDFYLSKNSYMKFLRKHNILDLFDNVYISCDVLKCKSNGTLYEHIVSELKLDNDRIIMIGDNEHSDNLMPKKLRIASVHIKNNQVEDFYKHNRNEYKTAVHQLSRISKIRKPFSNYAFSLYLFCESLYVECCKNKVKDLYFFAREGKFLKKLFELYLERKKVEIHTHYLYVSRNSIFPVGLKEIENENFSLLFRQYHELSIEKFLNIIGFQKEDVAKLSLDLSSLCRTIKSFDTSPEYYALRENSRFQEIYEKIRIKKKKAFLNYINANIKKDETLSIVDVGWKGSMQDYFFSFFDGKQKMMGYYLGLNTCGALSYDNNKMGLLFDRVRKRNNYNSKIYEFEHLLYEMILVADHGKTAGYDLEKCTPILITDEDVRAHREYGNTIQNNIENKFKMIQSVIGNRLCTSSEISYFKKCHSKLFFHRSFQEVHILYKMIRLHKDSFIEDEADGSIYKVLLYHILRPFFRIKNYMDVKEY